MSARKFLIMISGKKNPLKDFILLSVKNSMKITFLICVISNIF